MRLTSRAKFEIEKLPGSQVISGAINGDVALSIRAEKLVVDSRYARIMQVMQDAEQRRPNIGRLGDPRCLVHAGRSWACRVGVGRHG